ncbi:MAG: YggS family pyridoxal phosphate-dependent enzyme [Planctomycetaceae bacterium]|nr:YggS family pyridoxal phosphate-dependent enzyme [Planctomycetaceae bacterium]
MDAAQREILAANLRRVRERIAAACARVKRDPREVTLIAVTKSVGPEVMQALIELGVTDIGENKLQGAQEKFPQVPGLRDRAKVKRHFIGHLQTNKVKGVLELFDVIHSVDSLKLAEEIDKRARQLERPAVAAFIEVNVSGEESKQGLPAGEFRDFFMQALRLPRLEWQGLMTMAPLAQGDEVARFCFRGLRQLSSPFAGEEALLRLAYLSMGMSNDFELAIEEGATHVRIGTALFEGM